MVVHLFGIQKVVGPIPTSGSILRLNMYFINVYANELSPLMKKLIENNTKYIVMGSVWNDEKKMMLFQITVFEDLYK